MYICELLMYDVYPFRFINIMYLNIIKTIYI